MRMFALLLALVASPLLAAECQDPAGFWHVRSHSSTPLPPVHDAFVGVGGYAVIHHWHVVPNGAGSWDIVSEEDETRATHASWFQLLEPELNEGSWTDDELWTAITPPREVLSSRCNAANEHTPGQFCYRAVGTITALSGAFFDCLYRVRFGAKFSPEEFMSQGQLQLAASGEYGTMQAASRGSPRTSYTLVKHVPR